MAKKCKVCNKPYADDLEACPHCAEAEAAAALDDDFELTASPAAPEAAAGDEPDVDLSELFGEESAEEKTPKAPPAPPKKPPRKAPRTMSAVNLDDDAVDLGREDPEKAPSSRTKTQLISAEEMEAVARGESVEEEEASILDTSAGLDVGIDASAVDLGADDNLSSEASLGSAAFPTPVEGAAAEPPAEEELPVVEHAADDEELPVVESPAEDDEAPAEKPKKARSGRGWVYGAAGMVLGSAASIGLIVANVLPIDSLKDMAGTGTKPAPKVAPTQPVAPVQQAPVAAGVTPDQYLTYGDFGKAVEGYGAQESQDPAVLLKRGQARWLHYLQEKKQANAPLKKDDEAVVQATKDLTEAKTAEATFWLGLIEEATAGPAAARKVFQEGAAKFKDPADQRLFQSALDRLDSTPAAQQVSRGPRMADAALALVALTVLMQDQPAAPKQEPAAPAQQPNQAAPAQPQQPQQQPADATAPAAAPAKVAEEAGTDFWKATRLAKEQKYGEAIAALAKARATHDKERFLRLYKAQNPTTDPTEMIFLRACDELTAYWQMCQALSQSGYLAQGKPGGPVQALNAALTAAKESQGSGKAVAALAELLKKDKDVTAADPDVKDVAKAIQTLVAVKNKDEEQLAALHSVLADAKYVGDSQKDLAAGVKKALDDKKAATDALAAAAQALKAGQYDAQPDVAQGVAKVVADKKAAADKAVQAEKKLTETEAALKESNKQLADVKYAQSRQGRSQAPHQMMDIWLPLLAEARTGLSPSLCETAQRDARQVADDSANDAAARGRALCVEGLALRGQGKYDDARQALKKALDADRTPPKPGDWRFTAKQALQALTDPNLYYVPEARRLAAQGKFDQALARLDEALRVFPKTTPAGGAVLAERSAVRLAQAIRQGSVDPANTRVVDAIRDAKDAIAAGAAAEGGYALGRCQEALGHLAEARQAYEQALAAHPQQDVAGGKIRVALARTLVQAYGLKIPANDTRRSGLWHPATALVALFALTQYEESEAKTPPELDRAVQLADEAIRAGNNEGYLVKALALAAKHRWTDAVLEYSSGLAKSGSPEEARVLRYLMENHPSLRVPDGQRPPDVLAAERYFDQGLRYYWEQRYPQAEKQFSQAVRSFDQDARFVYFLGLAQLAQGNRDQATESFRQAAKLEQQGRPQGSLISAALERVQGPPRHTLNRYRP